MRSSPSEMNKMRYITIQKGIIENISIKVVLLVVNIRRNSTIGESKSQIHKWAEELALFNWGKALSLLMSSRSSRYHMNELKVSIMCLNFVRERRHELSNLKYTCNKRRKMNSNRTTHNLFMKFSVQKIHTAPQTFYMTINDIFRSI